MSVRPRARASGTQTPRLILAAARKSSIRAANPLHRVARRIKRARAGSRSLPARERNQFGSGSRQKEEKDDELSRNREYV